MLYTRSPGYCDTLRVSSRGIKSPRVKPGSILVASSDSLPAGGKILFFKPQVNSSPSIILSRYGHRRHRKTLKLKTSFCEFLCHSALEIKHFYIFRVMPQHHEDCAKICSQRKQKTIHGRRETHKNNFSQSVSALKVYFL
jgi:hypothetical protein